jgi:hypothetical protein
MPYRPPYGPTYRGTLRAGHTGPEVVEGSPPPHTLYEVELAAGVVNYEVELASGKVNYNINLAS